MVLVTGELAVTAVVMVRGSSDSSEGAVAPVVEGKVEKVARVVCSVSCCLDVAPVLAEAVEKMDRVVRAVSGCLDVVLVLAGTVEMTRVVRAVSGCLDVVLMLAGTVKMACVVRAVSGCLDVVKKKSQVGNKLSNILPKSSHARKEAPPPSPGGCY